MSNFPSVRRFEVFFSLHICVTCAKSNYNVTNLAEEIENIPGGIEALAICASCAIKNHCQKKHDTTELPALKIDYEYHQNIVEVKKLCKNLQEDNKKLTKKSNETKFLLESCRIECEHAVSVMKTSRGHRNYALAWPSLKKSFEVLCNTYSYCNIKLAEINARLVEGLPREALNLLEHKTHEHLTTRLRLDPITASMKFRLPGTFPVDQNIQVPEGEAAGPVCSPTPVEDFNEYDSPEDELYREYDEVRRDHRRQMIDSDGSDADDDDIIYRAQRRADNHWADQFSFLAAHSLANMRDAAGTARPPNNESAGDISRPDNFTVLRRRINNFRRRRRGEFFLKASQYNCFYFRKPSVLKFTKLSTTTGQAMYPILSPLSIFWRVSRICN